MAMYLRSCLFTLTVVAVSKTHLEVSALEGLPTSAVPRIISRAEWGARNATEIIKLVLPLEYIFIHHTAGVRPPNHAGDVVAVRGIQDFHMDDRKWADIGYSFLIGGDGSVFEGRGWYNVGAHTLGNNSKGYGIAFLGSYERELPSQAALEAAKQLIGLAITAGHLIPDYKLKGHRQMVSTECPGDALYAHIQTWPHFSN